MGGEEMSKRLSQLYGMDIYTENAEYVGKVGDVILNMEKGEVMRLALKSFRHKGIPAEEVRSILQRESIGYNDIVKVGDIIICKKHPEGKTKKGRGKRKKQRE